MSGLDNPIHLIFLLVLLLLVFGAKRLPEMGRSLGGGLRGFRDALSGDAQHHPALQQRSSGGSEATAADAARTNAEVAKRPA
jgi:sec-independent protein translocase protein TatA